MTTLACTAALRLRTGPEAGRLFEVRRTLRIGRHPYNEVSLADHALSRYHCWVTATERGFAVEDLASTNGTFVNGERLRARRLLRPGDRIRVGRTEFLFTEPE
jgi:pSer/pThr/pTyr-binding forkhead associated (FHA) protein